MIAMKVRLTQPFKHSLIVALSTAALLIAATPALYAQSNNDFAARENEKIDYRTLPSGRLEAIDWRNLELTIDGKRHQFNDDILKVYFGDDETTLVDLQPGATVRYQTSGSGVVVRIWAVGNNSLVDS